MTEVQIITLRPGGTTGSGDVIRASAIADALRSASHEVSFVSILAPGESVSRALADLAVIRAACVILRGSGRARPLQWVLVQAIARARSIRLDGAGIRSIYVTSRVVPDVLSDASAVDFVDALSRNAASRAEASRWLRLLWRREQRLLAAQEASIARRAVVATAVSKVDAHEISTRVQYVPIQLGECAPTDLAPPMPTLPTVVFTGNLYFAPNDDGARWIVTELVPELAERSWRPTQVVIAGRDPSRQLRSAAAKAGVALLADVPDMSRVLGSASVALAPMALGSGMQTKVLDALRAGVPVVLTPKANEGLQLRDSSMVRVVERSPRRFADAMLELVANRKLGGEPPADVAQLVASSARAAVTERWLAVLEPLLASR
jgi:hypothetical protein